MYDVIIIGAGPAGLMAANVLKGSNLLVLEKKEKAGKKLLITGGGRCNLTNLKDNQSFLEEIEHNQKALFSTLNNFGPYDIFDFFHQEVPLETVEEDQVFPISNKANDILNHLLKDIKNKIQYHSDVKEIRDCTTYIEVETTNQVYQASYVIVGTGGASYSMTGSSGDHMHLARMLEQPTIPLFPAETSILLKEQNNLAGTSFPNTKISFSKIEKTGHLMFTHKGLSGLSAMKCSEYVYLQKPKEIIVDFNTQLEKETIVDLFSTHREKGPVNVLAMLFTKRFSEYLIEKAEITQQKCKQLNKAEIDKIIVHIKEHPFELKGVEKLEKAYVTGGGIDVRGLHMKSFLSKTHPHIAFVGECVDIHGPIGGYNITLALSSGYSAALAIQNKLEELL
ncbi:BaiN/RdsA family NAD(P)/FAD-dependent oxidoreductase [Tannockella kyphosi]|uniref:NAD(P)/FAD-dependent oxidoreductase n=1 Tax=Tannockella kyphosi TaxID=2899121 RepID=UPI0020117E6B|nr:aminoacetone oxidase family FAD-binding enzyme [Tannockella kyphosi]